MLLGDGDKLPIALKCWIFKFLHPSGNVCVEGYRKQSDDELVLINWRSEAIEKRVTSQSLATVSGSSFILLGFIDLDSAIAFGYPKQVIERFKEGFPYDWKEFLADFYLKIMQNNILAETQWFESKVFDSNQNCQNSFNKKCLEKSLNTKREPKVELDQEELGKGKIAKEVIVEEDEVIIDINQEMREKLLVSVCRSSKLLEKLKDTVHHDDTIISSSVINSNISNLTRKWTKSEIVRLKLAVGAMVPRSDEDWEKVAKSLRRYNGNECRMKAINELNLKNVNGTTEDNNTQMMDDDPIDKAKVATLSYRHQAERFISRYLKTDDESDFFKDSFRAGSCMSDVVTMPSIASLDSDDSLITVLRTPTPKSANSPRNEMSCPKVSDSPDLKRMRPSSPLFTSTPLERKQQQRFVHQLSRARGRRTKQCTSVRRVEYSGTGNTGCI